MAAQNKYLFSTTHENYLYLKIRLLTFWQNRLERRVF